MLGLLAASAALYGQQIGGTVRDSTGLSVPGAQIKVTQTGTGLVRNATTGADGGYVFADLPTGPYIFEVAKEGFSKYVQSGILLQVGSNPTIDAVLKVGAVAEQLVVEADAAMVETHSTGIGQVVDTQRVNEMPLNGRQATQLILLAGLANGTGSSSTATLNTTRNYPTVLVSVAGGQGNGITFMLDGANYNDPANNLNLPLPFPDALQEFKLETSALPAQYGLHSAAAVNAVTKSGTNQFHGNLFEFVRNGDFNARDFFAPTRDTLKRNQFGGTLGGPIRRNKLFFFGAYQNTIVRSDPPQSFAYVPTPAMLAGDFTAFASTACNPRQITLPASFGFAGNQIAPSRFNPAALKVSSFFPVPTGPCGRIGFGLTSNSDEQLPVAKVDYQINDKHSLFGRLVLARLNVGTTYDGKNPVTLVAAAQPDQDYSIAVGDTYLFGASTVSSFRMGVNRTRVVRVPDKWQSYASLGIANVFQQIPDSARMSVAGNGFNIGTNNSPSSYYNSMTWHLNEDVSMVRGAHQFGFGFLYIHPMMNQTSGKDAMGTFAFAGQQTGLGLADFLLGAGANWTQGGFASAYNRTHFIGVYAQDTWKINSRLTASYGLRWEPSVPPYSKYNWYNYVDKGLFTQGVKSTQFVNAPAGLIFPGDPQWKSGSYIWKPDWKMFEPRFGLVWDPFGDGKMSVRASYGIFGEREHMEYLVQYASVPPFGNVLTLNNVPFNNPWANYPGGNPFPITPGKNSSFPLSGTYNNDQPDSPASYLHQWGFSVQRQVGANWLFTGNYVGNSSIHLYSGLQVNPAVYLAGASCVIDGATFTPCSSTNNTNQRRALNLQNHAQGQFYGSVTQNDPGGTAHYNGLLLSGQRRLSKGISVLANYTWSHCVGDLVSTQEGSTSLDSYTGLRSTSRGNCSNSDQRQNVNLSTVAQVPKLKNRALGMLASGWQVTTLLNIRSAQLFTVTTGVDNALNGQAGQRPNLVLANPYAANQTVDHWLNPAAFQSPATGTFGNLGINNLKGPGSLQLDMGLSRTFSIREKAKLQIRAESFNILNHLNPATPIAATNNGTFGQITSDINSSTGGAGQLAVSGDPRILQFAVKVSF